MILTETITQLSLGPPKFKVVQVTLTTPLSGMICHPWANTCYDQPTYQI